MQNYTDRPALAAFNEKCSIITGYYVGDGKNTRNVDLGVTPKAIILADSGSIWTRDGNLTGGIGFPELSTSITIIENGFRVYAYGGTNTYQTNTNNRTYQYIAFV